MSGIRLHVYGSGVSVAAGKAERKKRREAKREREANVRLRDEAISR